MSASTVTYSLTNSSWTGNIRHEHKRNQSRNEWDNWTLCSNCDLLYHGHCVDYYCFSKQVHLRGRVKHFLSSWLAISTSEAVYQKTSARWRPDHSQINAMYTNYFMELYPFTHHLLRCLFTSPCHILGTRLGLSTYMRNCAMNFGCHLHNYNIDFEFRNRLK